MTDPRTLLRAVGPEGSGRIESWGYHDGRFCLILPDGTFRLATHGNLASVLNELPEPKPRKATSRRVPVVGTETALPAFGGSVATTDTPKRRKPKNGSTVSNNRSTKCFREE